VRNGLWVWRTVARWTGKWYHAILVTEQGEVSKGEVCRSRPPTLQVLVLGLDAGRGPAQRHLHAPRARARGVGGAGGLPGALPRERARCGRDRKVRESAQCSTMSERDPRLTLPYAIKPCTGVTHLHGRHGAVAEGHGALARVHLPEVQV